VGAAAGAEGRKAVTDKPSDDPTKNFGLVSIIQKSTEIQIALLIYCFLIFFDICLELFTRRDVYQLAFDSTPPVTAFLAIQVVVVFVIFSIFMSLFMPLIAVVIRHLIIDIAYTKPFSWLWFDADSDLRRTHEMWSLGCVDADDLEEKAHETKDPFYMELAKDAVQRQRNVLTDYLKSNMLCLAAFVISGYSMLFVNSSLLQSVSSRIGDYGPLFVWLFISVFFACSIKLTLSDDDEV
jgi:hypothetical protein